MGMSASLISFIFLTALFATPMSGRLAWNRSPEIRTKSTFSCTHVSKALQNAVNSSFSSVGSLLAPMWQSAMWANLNMSLSHENGFVLFFRLRGFFYVMVKQGYLDGYGESCEVAAYYGFAFVKACNGSIIG